jgi:CRISPR/Cas system-associated exonuclease Cas4 (RecB family)
MTSPSMKPTRWSYSSISTYENCPRQWYYSYIEHIPTAENAAMLRGSRLHKLCEDYLNGVQPEVHYELRKVKKILEDLKARRAQAEVVWIADSMWYPVRESRMAWVKAIIDAHVLEGHTLFVHDFKSGREYPEHRDQLDLYGTIGLQVYPQAKRVEYNAIYLDTGHTSNDGALLRGDMLNSKIRSWSERGIKLMTDVEYKATPSEQKCKWCDYSVRKGGPCRVGK